MSNVSVKVGGRYCAAYLVSKAYYWEENLKTFKFKTRQSHVGLSCLIKKYIFKR